MDEATGMTTGERRPMTDAEIRAVTVGEIDPPVRIVLADYDPAWPELFAREAEWADHGIARVDAIGDAHAPGLIVHAVYAGHRYAREFDDPRTREERVDAVAVRRQRPETALLRPAPPLV